MRYDKANSFRRVTSVALCVFPRAAAMTASSHTHKLVSYAIRSDRPGFPESLTGFGVFLIGSAANTLQHFTVKPRTPHPGEDGLLQFRKIHPRRAWL